MTETVPADIAAAIDLFEAMIANRTVVRSSPAGSAVRIGSAELEAACVQAKVNVNAAILAHLRGYAEMKAALERIEQGV